MVEIRFRNPQFEIFSEIGTLQKVKGHFFVLTSVGNEFLNHVLQGILISFSQKPNLTRACVLLIIQASKKYYFNPQGSSILVLKKHIFL